MELIYLWQSAKHDSAYPAPYVSQMFTMFHDILPHECTKFLEWFTISCFMCDKCAINVSKYLAL